MRAPIVLAVPRQRTDRAVRHETAPALDPAPLRKTYLQAVAGLRGKRIVLVPGRVSAKNGCDLLSRKRSALRMCSR
jgi:hypothetical protein